MILCMLVQSCNGHFLVCLFCKVTIMSICTIVLHVALGHAVFLNIELSKITIVLALIIRTVKNNFVWHK